MNTQDIQILYAYNRWANARMLDTASCLTLDAFTQNPGSSPSVRNALTHILSAENIWLLRWQGHSSKMLESADYPDLAPLREKWAEVEDAQTVFLQRLTDEQLQAVIAYVNPKGEPWQYPLGHMMQHVVNHSSYHRGQVMTMLRQLGATPVSTDFLVYFDLKKEE